MGKFLHDTSSASAYLLKRGIRLKPRTLANLRVSGNGPVFRYVGTKPYYEEEALDAFIDAGLSAPVRSTSEARNLAQAS